MSGRTSFLRSRSLAECPLQGKSLRNLVALLILDVRIRQRYTKVSSINDPVVVSLVLYQPHRIIQVRDVSAKEKEQIEGWSLPVVNW
jgi:hypothetical protein